MIWVLFDLDETLFVRTSNSELDRTSGNYESYTHLTKCYLPACDDYFHSGCIYLIHHEKTSKTFQDLLALENVNIGFITAGGYTKEHIIPVLEDAYDLEAGALDDSLFVGANDFGNCYTLKGEKLNILRDDNIFAKQDHVILVDDREANLDSAVEYGFAGILATGFFEEYDATTAKYVLRSTDPGYLDNVLYMVRARRMLAEFIKSPIVKLKFKQA